MDGNSLNILSEKITQLKELFPEIFTENQIDFHKLQEILGKDIIAKNEYYQLSWAGKSQARANIYKTTTQTLKPCSPLNPLDNPNTHTLIKGENLEVLRILQKSYFNKIKMIYIDPPYNTGNDCFTYPDDFAENKKDYLERTELDNVSSIWKKNTRENGHFHSNWLSMMLPRLSIARGLLRDDGVIFISIDDNEASNLKLLCDEVFGEENFIVNGIWEKVKIRKNSAKWFSDSHDHILIYCKNKNLWERNLLPRTDTSTYKNPDKDERGVWIPIPIYANHKYDANYTITKPNGVVLEKPKNNYWRLSEETINRYIKENRLWWGEGNSYPMIKRFLTEVQDGLVPKSIFYYDEVGGNPHGDSELKSLFEGKKFFENPKSVRLIKSFLQISTFKDESALILDFFAGSGTTAQAVMELNEEDGGNRKFICVQLEEEVEETSEAYKAGYKNISEITETRIKKVVEKIKKQREGKIEFANKPLPKCQVYQLGKSNFKSWCNDIANIKEFKENLFDFQDSQLSPTEGNEENMLIELCLKRGLGFNMTYTKEDDFYKINTSEGALWFCFTKYHPEYKTMILEQSPKEVYMLNSSFDDDVALTNLKIYLNNEDINLILI